jgi:hypothetical protein
VIVQGNALGYTKIVYRSEMIVIEKKYPSISPLTLILIESARTFASAHRFVRGASIAAELNIPISVVYAS